MKTVLKIMAFGAVLGALAGCTVPECKFFMTCDPPVRHSDYRVPSYYSPTDVRVMYAKPSDATPGTAATAQ